jgi:hypothetical protein
MRLVLGIVLGIAAWFVAVTAIGYAIKMGAPSLDAALLAHSTTTALAERLGISFVATLFAGWLAAVVARDQRAALIAGILLLAAFVPYHLYGRDTGGPIWTHYPLWYHLTFFVSLILLSVLGGRLRRA